MFERFFGGVVGQPFADALTRWLGYAERGREIAHEIDEPHLMGCRTLQCNNGRDDGGADTTFDRPQHPHARRCVRYGAS